MFGLFTTPKEDVNWHGVYSAMVRMEKLRALLLNEAVGRSERGRGSHARQSIEYRLVMKIVSRLA